MLASYIEIIVEILLTVASASSVTSHVFQKELNCPATYQKKKNSIRVLVNGDALDSHWILKAELSPVDIEVSW